MGICRDAASCKEEIAAYISHPAGFPLLVGIDDAKIYANILGNFLMIPAKDLPYKRQLQQRISTKS